MRKTPLRGLFIMSRGLSSSSSPPKKIGIFHLVCCVHPFFLKREDMKHETRMARLGVCTFHVEYTSHPFRWLHTHRIMSTLEKAFWQYRTLVYTFLVQHKVYKDIVHIIWWDKVQQSSPKNVQKLDQLIFILYRGLPIHIRPDD